MSQALSLSPLTGPQQLPPQATHLLICLHGFGADGNDLIGLASPLQAALAASGIRLAVACPHAPQPTPMGHGRQWFRDNSWTFRDPASLPALATQLHDYVQQLQTVSGIPPERTVLLGFSQGAMTLLALLPDLAPRTAGVIALSGALTMPPAHTHPIKPPVLLLHGTDDDVLPADASMQAAAWLQQAGYPCRVQLQPHGGHGIDAATLAEVAVWLQALWANPPAA